MSDALGLRVPAGSYRTKPSTHYSLEVYLRKGRGRRNEGEMKGYEEEEGRNLEGRRDCPQYI